MHYCDAYNKRKQEITNYIQDSHKFKPFKKAQMVTEDFLFKWNDEINLITVQGSNVI